MLSLTSSLILLCADIFAADFVSRIQPVAPDDRAAGLSIARRALCAEQ